MTRKELEKDMANIQKMVDAGESIEIIQEEYIELIEYLWDQKTYTITQYQLTKLYNDNNKGNDFPGNAAGVLEMVDKIWKGEK